MNATTDFFQAGRTYQRGRWWTFQCLAVDTAPWDDEPRAVGFLIRTDGTGTVHGMTTEDWSYGGWVSLPLPSAPGAGGRSVAGGGSVTSTTPTAHDSLRPF